MVPQCAFPAGRQAQESGVSRAGNGDGEVAELPPMALQVMCWFLSILALPLVVPVVSRQGDEGWAEGVRFGAGWCLLSRSESGTNSSLISSTLHLFTLLGALGCSWGVLHSLEGHPSVKDRGTAIPKLSSFLPQSCRDYPVLNSNSFLPLTRVLYFFQTLIFLI